MTYDRRGRGDSGDTPPYAVEREIEDLVALIEATGGAADVYGHSSGAGLSLRAAAAGAPIGRLILYEPPFAGDDPDSQAQARARAAAVDSAIADGRPDEAIRGFLTAIGMPPEAAEAQAADPATLALAPTMPYDHAVMGDADGGSVPVDLVERSGSRPWCSSVGPARRSSPPRRSASSSTSRMDRCTSWRARAMRSRRRSSPRSWPRSSAAGPPRRDPS